jgi:predicted dinucleotide-binding enzyme
LTHSSQVASDSDAVSRVEVVALHLPRTEVIVLSVVQQVEARVGFIVLASVNPLGKLGFFDMHLSG